MDNMDYKKIADDARESAAICHGAGLKHLSGRILCYADAIENLLETVEAMKNPHIKIQIDYEELTIKEVCDRLERLKKERDKAVGTLKNSAHTFKFCGGCKHFGEKCSVSYYWCDDESEDHWEWEGLDG